MLNKSHGNMYEWVTHMHSHLAGECRHKCSYCYVQRNRHGVSPKYKGDIRLIEEEFSVNYGTGKTIFLEHMGDLFQEDVQSDWVKRILTHCNQYPKNTYVFQTKNPTRAYDFLTKFPPKFCIGVTIESNRAYPYITKAPIPLARMLGLSLFTRFKKEKEGFQVFVTVEPVLDFDVKEFVNMIVAIKPDFINIGADSKYCGLPEPTKEKLEEFIAKIQKANVEIKKKNNLKRILR